jgi:hypothetical protein
MQRRHSPEEKPKVLYLAGAHRSGTTLLTGVLGCYPGIFAAGELHEIWANLLEGRPCGCGRSLQSCPVWRPVLGEILDGSAQAPSEPEEAARWREKSAAPGTRAG